MEFQIPSPLEVAVIIVFLILTTILLLIGHLDIIFSWLSRRKQQKAVKEEMPLSDDSLRELLEQSLQLNGNAFEARKAMIEAALEASRQRNEPGGGGWTDTGGSWSPGDAGGESEQFN